MDGALLIRPADATDLAGISAIENLVFSTPWPQASFLALLGSCFLVIDGQPGIVGYGAGRVTVGEGEVLNLAVHPDHQGQGLGRRMLFTIVARLADNGAEVVFLEVRASNRSALALYTGFGFEEVGRRRSYYADPVEDALVLRHKIGGVTGVTKTGPESRMFD